MKPRCVKVALLLVGPIVLVIWLLLGRLALFRTTENPWNYPESSMRIPDGVKVGQSFVAHYPGLYRIDVLLTTFGHRSVPDLVFHLRADGPQGEELCTTTVDGAAIVDNAFQPFTFPPLDDSAGRSYFFYLESPGADPRDAVGVRISNGERNPEGGLRITRPTERPVERVTTSGEQPPTAFTHKVFLPFVAISSGPQGWLPTGDAGFMLHYKGRPLETIPIFLDRLAANKPLFWGEVWFYLLLLVLYPVLLVWFVGALMRIVQVHSPGEE
jgi:hypothetical protein